MIWLLIVAAALLMMWLIPYGFIVVPVALAGMWIAISVLHRKAIGGTDEDYAAHMARLEAKHRIEQEQRASAGAERERRCDSSGNDVSGAAADDPAIDADTDDGPSLAEWIIETATGQDDRVSDDDDNRGKGGSFGGGGASGGW